MPDEDDDLALPQLPSLPVVSQEDRIYCQKAVVGGSFDALRHTAIWRNVREWAARPEIQAEIDALRQEYAQRTGIQEREQFLANRSANSLLPYALNVLKNAMVNSDNTVTSTQLKAACKTIDMVNAAKYGGQDQVPVIDARQFITNNISVMDSVVAQMSPAERQAAVNMVKRFKLKAQVTAAEAASEIKDAEVVAEDVPVEKPKRPLPPRRSRKQETEE